MNKKKISSITATAVIAVALVCFAAYLLAGIYPDVLITAQDRNMFADDTMYFSQQVSHPFGLFQFIGGYLTQYFYTPAIGAGLLIAMWALTVYAGIKAFRLKGIWQSLMIVPAACLLTSELDLGYWIYCLTIPGYWFSQSLAFLCTILLLWAATQTPRRIRLVWYVAMGFVLFPAFGWMSYLFAPCLALMQIRKTEKGLTYPTWIDALGLAVTVAAPFFYEVVCYDYLPSREVYNAGFPFFNNSVDYSLRPTKPFFVLTAVTILASLGGILPAIKKIPAAVGMLIVGVASTYCVWKTIFHDDNYLLEMQMTQAAMDDDWKGVVNVAEQTKTPSRTMVMLKNIALLNTGELGSRSYDLGNDGKVMYNPDSLNINIMHIAGPVVYYNYGVTNYSNRWCMEFTVPYGFSPFYLKIMARSAEANGETDLAQKYISRLHNLKYYADWKPAPLTPVVKELHGLYTDSLVNDENNCERYFIKRFSEEHHPGSKYHCDLSLFYSTLSRTAANYWPSLYDYLTINKTNTLPKGYEEAYCVFGTKRPTNFPLEVKVNEETVDKYRTFMTTGNSFAQSGMPEEGVREAMRDEWSGTYWWFNAFGRNSY